MGSSIRVLLVCGDGLTAERTVDAIEAETDRIDVRTVTSVDRAVARLDQERFECVVCERELRNGDVLETLERVRRRWTELPFLIHSAGDPVVEEALSSGATGYVPKTDDVDVGVVLANRIENSVERYRALRETGRPATADAAENSRDHGRDPAHMLDQLFTHVPTHLYVKDREGRYLYVSDYYIDEPDAQIGRTDREVYPDPIGEEAYADDMRVIETGDPIIGREEYAAFQDEWNLTSKVPWYDGSGDIAGVMGVTRRITDLKETEERLERQNERLEELVETVSHDLRNPLTVAQGRIELIREECESEHFDAVVRAHDRMETLVEEVLTLAAERDGQRDPEPVDLGNAARRCWETVETRDATLHVATDATVQSNEQQLQQLLENLVRNAIEHGGDDVTVTVGDCAGGFYVADDGVGIPRGERDRVFERGYSADGDGTGFGLSIVAQIVDRNDWDVRVVESDEGGARFEVTDIEFDN